MPLFVSAEAQRPIAWRRGAPVPLAEFRTHVAAVVAQLPKQSAPAAMIDLCEDRYKFLVAYAAALSVGHTVLLPSSRAEQVVADVANANAGSYRIDDQAHLEVRRWLRQVRPPLAIVGVYHSHPEGDAVPSATDVGEAYYPDWLYVIAGMRRGVVRVRGYRIADAVVAEVRIDWRGGGLR